MSRVLATTVGLPFIKSTIKAAMPARRTEEQRPIGKQIYGRASPLHKQKTANVTAGL